jgi:type I restriction enzyme S subunit
MVVPIPPAAEQRRIISRVDELMNLCDELQALLNSGQAQRRQLLDAILHYALESPAIRATTAKSA